MNNPNPFVPKGSLLEQQSQRRSRLKLAVFCVLAVCVTGLVGMLIQGCKREKPETDLNPPSVDTTNPPPMLDTNPPPVLVSNPPVPVPPSATNPPPQIPDTGLPPTGGSEYVVAKGDSLAKIAKKSGVTLKALQAANPGVVPTKLKVGQKLVIPAGGKTSAPASTGAGTTAGNGAQVPMAGSGEAYVVKSGDTLTKIAKAHGLTVKVLQAANNLTTTKIHVGQKLKVPSKAEAAAPAASAPVPAVDTTPAPPVPVVSAPAPAPAH